MDRRRFLAAATSSVNLATNIAVDDLGELGQGSLGLELFVDPVSEPIEQLKVAADMRFSRGGTLAGSYRAETLELFDVVAGSDQTS